MNALYVSSFMWFFTADICNRVHRVQLRSALAEVRIKTLALTFHDTTRCASSFRISQIGISAFQLVREFIIRHCGLCTFCSQIQPNV